jgi:hypothetical protein
MLEILGNWVVNRKSFGNLFAVVCGDNDYRYRPTVGVGYVDACPSRDRSSDRSCDRHSDGTRLRFHKKGIYKPIPVFECRAAECVRRGSRVHLTECQTKMAHGPDVIIFGLRIRIIKAS